MLDVALLLGADPEMAARDMKEVLNFEMSLANITLKRYKYSYHTRLLGELSKNSYFLADKYSKAFSSPLPLGGLNGHISVVSFFYVR